MSRSFVRREAANRSLVPPTSALTGVAPMTGWCTSDLSRADRQGLRHPWDRARPARPGDRPRPRRRLRRASPGRRASSSAATCARRAWSSSAAFSDGADGAGRRRRRPRPGVDRPRLLRRRPLRRARRDVHRLAQPGAVQRRQAVPGRRPPGRRRHRPGRRAGGWRRRCSPATVPCRRRRRATSPPSTCSTSSPTTSCRSSTPPPSRPLRVVADTANGMGGLVVPKVFERLPQVELEVMYGELDGTFPNHPADPIQPANQRDLQARVVAGGVRRRPRLRRRRRPGLRRRRDRPRPVGLDHHGAARRRDAATSTLAAPSSTTSSAPAPSPRSSASTAASPSGPRSATRYIKQIMAETRRRVRRRALGPLLLPRQLPGRLRHHRHDARARAAEPGRRRAVGAAQALRALRRLGRDQHRRRRPARR